MRTKFQYNCETIKSTYDKKNIKKKYSTRDHMKALKWAKKVMIINKLGSKCQKCGEDSIFVLEFHHSKGQKQENLSRIMGRSIPNILKEAEKCTLLCRNCHTEEHYKDSNMSKIMLLGLYKNFKCLRCGYAGSSYSSLDFHHLNPSQKNFRVSSLKLHENSKVHYIDRAQKEIDKCIVLCKNCHLEDHLDKQYFKDIIPLIRFKLQNHINQKTPEPNRNQQLKTRFSGYRNRLALWLKIWRKTRCVKEASFIVGLKVNTLSANLMYSKIYRRIRKRLSKKTSKYQHVSWSKSKNKWIIYFKVNKKTMRIKAFDDEDEAGEYAVIMQNKFANQKRNGIANQKRNGTI